MTNPQPQPSTALAVIEMSSDLLPQKKMTALDIFGKEGGADPILKAIEDHIESFVPDLETAAGRKAITSLSATVSSTRAEADRARKALKKALEDQIAPVLQQIAVVDKEGKKIQDKLAALRDKARQPLTDWETAEAARKDAINKRLYDLEQLVNFPYGQHHSAASVAEKLEAARATVIDESWQELQEQAAAAKEKVIAQLEQAHRQAVAHEEQQAELERLREAQRQQAEKDRQREIEAEAERKAQEAAAAKVREAENAKLLAEKKAEQAAADERAKIAEEQRQQELEAKRREADREHRGRINREARDKIMEAMRRDDDEARKIATQVLEAIAKGEVPHVSIRY